MRALANACCAFCNRSVALACCCRSRSAFNAVLAFVCCCFNAFILAFAGVIGLMVLIAVISFMRIKVFMLALFMYVKKPTD